MQARVAHPVRSLVHQLLGHHPAEGDAEHVDALVSEDIEHPLDGPGDPGNAAWPGVGRGLPHTGRVEADRLHSARTEFPFEGCGEVEARADAGDEQQRAAGAAHRGAQANAVDVDEPDRRRLR
jgi:hypothetical protein